MYQENAGMADITTICYKHAIHLTTNSVIYHISKISHFPEERYLKACFRHAHKVYEGRCFQTANLLPGNIIATRVRSHIFNHGGIVTLWPRVIHCISPVTCLVDAVRDPYWASKDIVAFDPWLKLEEESKR